MTKEVDSEEVDSEGIEDLPRNVDSPDGAAKLVRRIVRIVKSNKNNILTFLIFTGGVTNLKINKATINFKIGIIKFIKDYPKMRKSSVFLHFLKNSFKVDFNYNCLGFY